jgi:hypothetical protein
VCSRSQSFEELATVDELDGWQQLSVPTLQRSSVSPPYNWVDWGEERQGNGGNDVREDQFVWFSVVVDRDCIWWQGVDPSGRVGREYSD